MSFLAAFAPVLAAAVLSGASSGLLGVYVMGLRMPFLAVCTAHMALAGAVVGYLLGGSVHLGAFLGALAGAGLLGYVLRRRTLEINAALGSVFSLSMGVAFLGLGLVKGPKTAILELMWGSVLFVRTEQLCGLLVAGLLLLAVTLALEREMKVLIFDRLLASTLFAEAKVFMAILMLAAAIITFTLETTGGLLLYSLICNPAIVALRLCRGFRSALLWSAGLGAASAVLGFVAAWLWDLPVGACIVLVSSLPVVAVLNLKSGGA